MYVHLEILDARESLVGLGSDPRDRVVLRAGAAPSPRSKVALPVQVLDAPLLGVQTGVALTQDIADDMQRELTKRAKHRAVERHLLRLQVTKRGQWIGTIFVQLLCLMHGHVVDRWINMHPVKGVPLGGLRVRIALGATKEDALAAFYRAEPTHEETVRSAGCACDVCDPFHERLDEATTRARLEKNERAPLGCTVM